MERFRGRKKQVILWLLVAVLILISYILHDVLMVAENMSTVKAADVKNALSNNDEICFKDDGPIEVELSKNTIDLDLLNYEELNMTTGRMVSKSYDAYSTDQSVLEVEKGNGYVRLRLKKAGTTTVNITQGSGTHVGLCDSIQITVKDEKVSNTVNIPKTDMKVQVGKKASFTFDASDRVYYSIEGNNSAISVKINQDSTSNKNVVVEGKSVATVNLTLFCEGASDTIKVIVVSSSSGQQQGPQQEQQQGQTPQGPQQGQTQQQAQQQQQQVNYTYTPLPQAVVNQDSTGDIYVKPGEDHQIHLLNVDRWDSLYSDNQDVIQNSNFSFNPYDYTHINFYANSNIKYNTWTDIHLLNYGNADWSGGNHHWRVFVLAEPIIEKNNNIHMYVGEELTLMENGDRDNYSMVNNTSGAISSNLDNNYQSHPLTIKAEKAGSGTFKVYNYGNTKWGYNTTKEYNITVTEKPTITYSAGTVYVEKGKTVTNTFKPKNYKTITITNEKASCASASNTADGYVKDDNGNITGIKITGNNAGQTKIKATITDNWGKTAEATWDVVVNEPLTVTITPLNLKKVDDKYWTNSKEVRFKVQFNQMIDDFTNSHILNLYKGSAAYSTKEIKKLNNTTYEVILQFKDNMIFGEEVQFIIIPGMFINGSNVTLHDSEIFKYNVDRQAPKVDTVTASINSENGNQIDVEFTVKDNYGMAENKDDYTIVDASALEATKAELQFYLEDSDNSTRIQDFTLVNLEKTREKYVYKATITFDDINSVLNNSLKMNLSPKYINRDKVTDIAGNSTENYSTSFDISELINEYNEKITHTNDSDDQDENDRIPPVVTMNNIAREFKEDDDGKYVEVTANFTISDNKEMDANSPKLSYYSDIIVLKNNYNLDRRILIDGNKVEIDDPVWDMDDDKHPCTYTVTSRVDITDADISEENKIEYDIYINANGIRDTSGNQLKPYRLSFSDDYQKFIRQIQIVNKDIEITEETDDKDEWKKTHSIKLDLMNSEDEQYVEQYYTYKWVNAETNEVVENGNAQLGEIIRKSGLNGKFSFTYEVVCSTQEGKITGVVGPFNFDNKVSENENAKLVFKEAGTDDVLFDSDNIEEIDAQTISNYNLNIIATKVYKLPNTNKDLDVSIAYGNDDNEEESGFKEAAFIVYYLSELGDETKSTSTILEDDKTYILLLATRDNAGNDRIDAYIVDKEKTDETNTDPDASSDDKGVNAKSGSERQKGNETSNGTEGEQSKEEEKMIEELDKKIVEKEKQQKEKEAAIEMAKETSKKVGEINKAGAVYFIAPAIIGLVTSAIISIKKYKSL